MYIVAIDYGTGRLIHSAFADAPMTDDTARRFLAGLFGEVFGAGDVWPADATVVEVYNSRSVYGIGRTGSKSTNYGVR